MQSNYGSFIGMYGEKAKIIVKKFLENNMIHFLGTDVHRQNTIYPRIPQILSEINELIGEEKLRELTTINPRLVLGNKRIDIRKPHKIELTFKEKMIMSKGESFSTISSTIKDIFKGIKSGRNN